MSRSLWVTAHRIAGLYLAFFLVVAGSTGCVLAFAGDLQGWLNPPVVVAASDGRQRLDDLVLRERALALLPAGRNDAVEFTQDPARAFSISLDPRTDPVRGQPMMPHSVTLVLDPYTGRELSRRVETDEGFWPVTRRNFVPLLVALHFSLALPGTVGVWLFGIAAVIWTVDCFVGAYLTFPARLPAPEGRPSWWQRWQRSWRVKRGGSAHRLTFDLHRAGGLWVWVMLLVLAWSGVGMTLRDEVFHPVMDLVLERVEYPVDSLPVLAAAVPEPGMSWAQARTTGRELMAERAHAQGFAVEREGWLIYQAERGLFFYGGRTSRDLPGARNESYVVFDGTTGRFVAESQPTGMAAGNTINQWLFALHRAQVWGLPYQVLVSVMGAVVVLLSLTGVSLWLRKRYVRQRRAMASPSR